MRVILKYTILVCTLVMLTSITYVAYADDIVVSGYDTQNLQPSVFGRLERTEGIDLHVVDTSIYTSHDIISFDLINNTNSELNYNAISGSFYLEAKVDGQWYILTEYQCYLLSYRISKIRPGESYRFYVVRDTLKDDYPTENRFFFQLYPGEHRFVVRYLGTGISYVEFNIYDSNKISDSDTPINADGEFTLEDDIKSDLPSTWAASKVQSAINVNIVPVSLQADYHQPITRAEFSSLVIAYIEARTGMDITTYLNQEGIQIESAGFMDTQDTAILNAHALGIIQGMGEGRFEPNLTITREQIAAMLMRTQEVLGADTSASSAYYADSAQFSSWAVPYIDYVTKQGIMNGIGNSRFDPQGSCTREQAIIAFYRMFAKWSQ